MVKRFGKKSKKVVRTYIKDLVTRDMIIFSLPYLNFEIEKQAAHAICCEKDEKTYLRQKKVAPSNCRLHHCYASEMIGEYTYDLVYLDLCGSLSMEFFKCLENLNLAEDGRLIVTLLKAREPQQFTQLLKPDRTQGYAKIFKKYGLYIYQTIEYRDTSPMIVIFATKNRVSKVKRLKID